MGQKIFLLTIWCVFGPLLVLSQSSKNAYLVARWFDEDPPTNSRDARFNDVWAFVWEGEEYAAIGSTLGTHIVKLELNNAVIDVAFIPGDAQGGFVIHRDFTFYQGFLYGVCDQQPSQLQIIDCRTLPNDALLVNSSSEFFTTAHNIFVDEYTGKLYVSGPSANALVVLDASADPQNPTLLNAYNGVGYVHDVYARRDTVFLHAAQEGMFVFDFSEADAPVLLGDLPEYPEQGYNHSGWLNEDGSIYVFADETPGTSLKVVDTSSLQEMTVLSLLKSNGPEHTMPHNLVVKDNFVYVAYYFDGLQVFDISDPTQPELFAWYDTFDGPSIDYRGAWGVHVGLPSGRVLICDRHTGLYVFRLKNDGTQAPTDDLLIFPNPGNGDAILQVRRESIFKIEHRILDAQGKLIDEGKWQNTTSTFWIPLKLQNANAGMYFIEVIVDEGTPVTLKYLKQ